MKTKKLKQSTYKIEGKFIGFIPKPESQLKYIQVQVGSRILPIKLAKEIRKTLAEKLVEGDLLSILLEQKNYGGLSKLKLKSEQVTILGNKDKPTISESISVSSSSPLGEDIKLTDEDNQQENPKNSSYDLAKYNKKEQILLCSKSGCSKRGGKQIYRFLIQTLEELELQNRVNIKLTGCQKQCKKAPSITLMPGKIMHNYINLKDISSLLKNHYLLTI